LSAPLAAASTAPTLSAAATQWWADIAVLADDNMEGRQTGSAGYMRAADYVVSRFKAEGLKPAGVDGFLQPVMFEQQLVDQKASRLDLVGAAGTVTPLRVGEYSRGHRSPNRSTRRWCSWATDCICRSTGPTISRAWT
jgi:hypothetical protein